jgi:transposase
MTIIGGFDLHRHQITFECVDTDSGELSRGQIRPASRDILRAWLAKSFYGRRDVKLAVEGCTGWRYVIEEMRRAGVEPHLAEPADTAGKRGPKRRAKTDKTDAQLLRTLLHQDDLPESWIPPDHVLEVRTLLRLYLTLIEERRSWLQRIHAQLYHQGVPPVVGLRTASGRAQLEAAPLSPAAHQTVATALVTIDALQQQIDPLKTTLQSLGRKHPGPRALTAHYGIGPLCAVFIWAELGDCRRFRRSDQAVRFAGLDVTVWSTDGKRTPGLLSRQGSPELRWALYEAAKVAGHERAPDHPYYAAARDRLGAKRATLSEARKLLRQCYHTLRELGDEAWQALQPLDERAA